MQKLKKEKTPRELVQDDRLVVERFTELVRSLKRFVREDIAPFSEAGLTEERIRCLAAMRCLGKSQLKSLAVYDGLSPSAQCIMLNQLVREGLVTRSDDPEDRRNVFYELTASGRALLSSEMARRTEFFRGRLSRFGSAEKASFARAIEKVLAGLQKLASK